MKSRLIKVIVYLVVTTLLSSSLLAQITVEPPANPRDDFTSEGVYYQVGNKLYATNQSMIFNGITISDNYIELNSTRFVVDSPNSLNITLDFIHNDFSSASNGDMVLSFYANSSGGLVYFNLSGFVASTQYNVKRDGTSIATPTANSSGYISFTNSVWSEHFFEIFTEENAGENWWDSNWLYRKPIAINSSYVDGTGTLENFTVLLNFTDSALISKALDNGYDIAFVSYYDNTSQYNHEIELYDNTTGRLVAWVKIPELYGDETTYFWMYYGNSGASNQENVEATWDSDYRLVLHMDGNEWQNITDSTSYSHDAVGDNLNQWITYESAGKIGYGVDFMGDPPDNDCYLEVDQVFTEVNKSDDVYTWEFWFNPRTDSSENRYIVSQWNNTASRGVMTQYYGNPTTELQIWEGDGAGRKMSEGYYQGGTDYWCYLCFKQDSNAGADQFHMFVNGSNVLDATGDTIVWSDVNVYISNRWELDRAFNGTIDEVRVHNISRSDEWIKTSYNTSFYSDEGLFISLGSEESLTYNTIELTLEDSYNVGAQIWTTPAIADIDGDGDKEIVIGATTDYVYVFNHDGTDILLEDDYYAAGGNIDVHPALYDIDHDDEIEILIASWNNYFYIFNHSGTTIYLEDSYNAGYSWGDAAPAIGDVDDDGVEEIVIGNYDDKKLYVFNYTDGNINLEDSSGAFSNAILCTSVLSDIDNDSVMEILVPCDDNKIHIFHHDGSTLTEEANFTFGNDPYTPSVADVDDDGELEIIVPSEDNSLHILNHSGTVISEEASFATGADVKGVALGDVDNDGTIEMCFGADKFYVVSHDGSSITEEANYSTGNHYCPTIVTDLNNNGALEIITVNTTDLLVFNHDGSTLTLLDSAPIVEQPLTSPVTSDVDDDGIMEIILTDVGGVDGNYIYIYGTNGSYVSQTDWPEHELNRYRTSYIDDVIPEWSGPSQNSAPAQSSESPSNTSTGIGINPTLSITVDDADDDALTAYWYSNSSGTESYTFGETSESGYGANPFPAGTYKGILASPDYDGYAQNISVYIAGGYDKTIKCGLYNSDLTFYASTEEKVWDQPGNGWFTLNFTSPPYIDSDNNYYISFFVENETNLYYKAGGAGRITGTGTYPTWDNPADSSDSSYTYVIYCSYTTGNDDWELFATNNSIDTSGGSVTLYQTNSNFSGYDTIYYWSLNLTDGTDWNNETYYFTTESESIEEPEGWYVSFSEGADSNIGNSSSSPWQNISYLDSKIDDSTVGTGDDIFFKRGDYFNDASFNLNGGGTPSNYMIIGAYGTGEKPIFNYTGDKFYCDYNGMGYVRFENLNFTGEGSGRQIFFYNGCENHNISICSCDCYDETFIKAFNTRDVTIENCYISPNSVTEYGMDLSYSSSGSPDFQSENWIIRNTTIKNCQDGIILHYGGSEDQSMGDNYFIFNCTFSNTSDEEIIDLVGGETSNHVLVKNCTFDDTRWITVGHGQHNVTIEDCIFKDAHSSGFLVFTRAYNLRIRNNIFQNWNSGGWCIVQNQNQYEPYEAHNISIFQNTLISDGAEDFLQFDYGDTEIDYVTVKNNIFMSDQESSPSSYIKFEGNSPPGNLSNIESNWTTNIWWRGDGIGESEVWDYSSSISNNYTEWLANDEVSGDLVDDPELADIDNDDYTLNSTSPCIDTGSWLTTTVGSGSSEQWVTVDDANYFFGGFVNIGAYPHENVSGDNIFVGTNTNLVITEINYVNNTIKVNRSISWSANDIVSLSSYQGNAPDIGAKESQYTLGPENNEPTQSSQQIWNSTSPALWNLNSTFISLTPSQINVTINDLDGNNMDWYMMTNESGTWSTIDSDTGISNGTVTTSNTSWIADYNTLYWISFNVTDGTDWTNATYHFTSHLDAGVDYFFSNLTGADSNYGTSPDYPWENISKFKTEIVDGGVINHGDNIYFKRGETHDFSVTPFLRDDATGLESNPMIFDSYGEGDYPKLTHPDGTIFDMYDGEMGWYIFQHLNFSEAGPTAGNAIGSDCGNVYNVTIRNCTFWDMGTAGYMRVLPYDWHNFTFENNTCIDFSLHILEGCSHTLVRNCLFDGEYSNGGYGPDLITIHYSSSGAPDYELGNIDNYHYIENCTVRDTQANAIDIVGGRGCQWVYVKGCNLSDCGSNPPISVGHENEKVFIEDCYIDTGVAINECNDTTFRNCVIKQESGSDLVYIASPQYFSGWPGTQNLTFYHNTFISNGTNNFLEPNVDHVSPYNLSGFTLKNNIFYSTSYSSPLYLVYYHPGGEGIWNLSTTDSNYTTNLWWTGDGDHETDRWSLEDETCNLTEWLAHDEVYNDMFMNASLSNPTGIDFDSDFLLNEGSPAVDNGSWLTQTDGSGNGQWVTLDYANYFFPGFTVCGEIIPGDNIFVGDETDLEVIDVNYRNKSIMVNRSISWSDDDYVSLSSYHGNAPDIGAKESSYSYLPPTGTYDGPDWYFSSSTGDDDNLGSIDSPWQNLSKINAVMGTNITQSSDIYLKCGDSWTVTAAIDLDYGGTISDPMVIGSYGSGDKPQITRTGGNQIFYMDYNGAGYITFQDLNFTNGDSQRAVFFYNACNNHNVTFSNCDLYGAGCLAAFLNTKDVLIENCYINPNSASRSGISVDYYSSGGVQFQCHNFIIRNNTILNCKDGIHIHFQDGGEVEYGSIGDYFWIENNTITNSSEEGMDLVGGRSSNYYYVKNCTLTDEYIYVGHGTQNVTIDSCVFNHVSSEDSSIVMSTTNYTRIRNCVFNGWGNKAINKNQNQIGTGYGPDTTYNISIYQNTMIYDSASTEAFVFTDTENISDWVFKNNIFLSTEYDAPNLFVNFYGYRAANFTDSNWSNNVWYRGDNGSSDETWWTDDGGTYTFAQWQGKDYTVGELRGDPELGDADGDDYTLNSTSICVDNGSWLTQTNGAGSGTWITLDDANYFFAGFTILGETISGDNIFVDDETNLEIVDINYINDSIKVNRSISWSDDDVVSLSGYQGNAPDIGAFESGYSYSPPAEAYEGPNWYVSNSTGNDNNDGSIGNPWKTIAKVNSEFGANINIGDNIYFKRGDTWEEDLGKGVDSGLDIELGGISDDYMVIGAYGSGAQPILNNTNVSGGNSLTTSTSTISCDDEIGYIQIENIHIYTFKSGVAYASLFFTEQNNYNDIVINNLTVEGGDDAIFLMRTENYTVYNCTINNVGGGGVIIYATDNTVAGRLSSCNGTISYCNITDVEGDGIAFHYRDGSTGDDEINGALGNNHWVYNNSIDDAGNGDAEESIDIASGFSFNYLVENNTVNNSNQATICHGVSNVVFQNNYIMNADTSNGLVILKCNNTIVRNNVIRYCPGKSGIQISDDPEWPENLPINATVYNNDILDVSAIGMTDSDESTPVVGKMMFKNNLIYSTSESTGNWAIIKYYYGANLSNKNTYFDNNLWWRQGGLNWNHWYLNESSGLNWSEWYANGHTSDELRVNASLVDAGGIGYPNDYYLQEGSVCVDNGSWLTQCSNSGGPSSTITVDDAGYFSAGISALGVDADTIFIGSERNLKIMSIDYESDTITVNRSISWNENNNVSLENYNGNKLDIGAFESSYEYSPPLGDTIFVSTTGSDSTGDGTIGNPYASLNKAMTEASDSYTIYMRGGNYNNIPLSGTSGITISHSGTVEQPFIIKAYNHETVVLNFDGKEHQGYSGMINIFSQNNITLEDLIIENITYEDDWTEATPYGLCINGDSSSDVDNIQVINCTFRNTIYNAIFVWCRYVATYGPISNIVVRDCYFENTQWNTSLGETTSFTGAVNVQHYNNTYRDIEKIGVVFSGGCYNVSCHDNDFQQNGSEQGDSIYCDPQDYNNGTVSHVNIYNNHIWGEPESMTSWGQCAIGICGEDEGGFLDNITIYNNLINLSFDSIDTDEYTHGIDIRQEYSNPAIYDNITVMYNTIFIGKSVGKPIVVSVDPEYVINMVIANNILVTNETRTTVYQFGTGIGDCIPSDITMVNNTYNHTTGTAMGGNWYGSTYDGYMGVDSINASPEFVDYANGNFQLNASSPCIDTANSTYTVATDIIGTSRPQFDGYDIGAYESLIPYSEGWTNTNPTIEVVSPANNSNSISLQPVVIVWINDTDGNQSTVDFYSSTNGIDWTWQQTNLTVLDEMVSYDYTEANSYSTDYYWKVTANDGNDNVSVWFKFTTEAAPPNNHPYQSSPYPANNSNNVLITTSQITIYINDTEGNPMNWTIETSPDVGSQDNSSSSDTNGTKSCSISGLSYSTVYTWYMNLTDGYSWNNETYVFTVEAAPPNNKPWQNNPYPANNSENVSISLSQLLIYVNDTDGDGMNFTIETSPDIGSQDNSSSSEGNGTKACSVSGLQYSTVYTWYVNLSDGEDSNNSYYVFTTMEEPYNNPPWQSSPDPSNNTMSVSMSLTNISIYINDTEGNLLNWTIVTSPNIGSNSSNGDINGTKYCDISGLDYYTVYTWYVNVTDGCSWNNSTYNFRTVDNPVADDPPAISSPYPSNGSTGVGIVPACRITAEDPEGEAMNVSFYENSTGIWVLRQVNASVNNGTFYWDYNNATGYGAMYWWKVSAYDGSNYTNATYHFTTIVVTGGGAGGGPDETTDKDKPSINIPIHFFLIGGILFAILLGAISMVVANKKKYTGKKDDG